MDRVMTTSVAADWSRGHRTTVPFLSHVCPLPAPRQFGSDGNAATE
jgi:hypothetical protein